MTTNVDNHKMSYLWYLWYGFFILWSIFWAIKGWGSMASGFHVGILFFWILAILNRLRVTNFEALVGIQDEIIALQKKTIKHYEETR